MAKGIRISAHVSETTRQRMEKHVRRTGVRKGHFIEQALLHHLQALEEIPAEHIVHPRIVDSPQTLEEMVLKGQQPNPIRALRDLMRGLPLPHDGGTK